MQQNRRQFLRNSAGLALTPGISSLIKLGDQAQGTKIVLLGTKGGPRVGLQGRRNTAVLIMVNDTPIVVDCGYGVTLQLLAAGVPLNTLRYIFITHPHSDHSLEYGPLIHNSWVTGLPIKIDAYGPPGMEFMTRSFFDYMKADIDVRIGDEGRQDIRKNVIPHDITSAGVVLKTDELTVTAASVIHPEIKQAYAYRFDTKDRSVVVSGDTTYAPALAELAKGADVLIHEVMYVPGIGPMISRAGNPTRLKEHLLASHTVPEDVGKIAAQAGVKTLVLYHLIPGDDSSITDEQWTADIRKHFTGKIIVGKDLMEI